jgi:DNA gyrase/topoisomerase IV subunit A
MSVDSNGPGGTPNTPGGEGSESGKKNVVAYESYQKLLDEKKRAQEKLEEFEKLEKERAEKLLAEQGKFQELLDAKEKELKSLKDDTLKTKMTFGKKTFESETKAVALSMGVNPEAIDDFIKVGDWSEVKVNDDFTIDQEQIKASIAKMQQLKPFYFQKNVSAPKDIHVAGSSPVGGKSVKEMTRDELVAHIKSMAPKK